MNQENIVLKEKSEGKIRPAKRWIFLFIIILAIIVFVLFTGVKRTKQRLATAPVLHQRPVPVETALVKRENLRNSMHFLARLEPVSSAFVSSRITANLKKLFVYDGDAVKKGQLLAELDDRDILAGIDALRATIKAMYSAFKSNKAMIGAAEKDSIYLKREYGRDKKLFKGQGLSASALDASRNRVDTADEKLKSLVAKSSEIKHNLASLKAKLDEIRTKLSYTKILSPSTGRVEKRLLEKGDLAQPGKPIFSIMNMTAFRLAINIVQEDLSVIHPGQTVIIRWSALQQDSNGKRISDDSAILSRIYPALGTGRTIRAEIDLNANIPKGIKIGSFIPVNIVVNEARGLTVPRNAIIPAVDNVKIVYAIRDKKIVPVKVKELFSNETRTLVTGNIKENDQVAINEFLQWIRLNPGELVEVIK